MEKSKSIALTFSELKLIKSVLYHRILFLENFINVSEFIDSSHQQEELDHLNNLSLNLTKGYLNLYCYMNNVTMGDMIVP